MIKRIGYYIFASFFAVFRIFGIRRDKVFFVATHDDSAEGNIGIVSRALTQKKPEIHQFFLTRKDSFKKPITFFVCKAYHMATAGTIFLDNEFMPMAYTPISKKAKVVQLWHGTGSIKKFGLDSEEGEVADLARKANRRITHLIVNSKLTQKQYAGAFEIPEEKIYITGLPRTDLILDSQEIEKKRQTFREQFPELQNKRCILYAPTFRDEETQKPGIHLDLDHLTGVMSEEDVLLLRLHPFVAANFDDTFVESRYHGKVKNVSQYDGVTTLLAVSDCLITDYSSIVFEYCLFEKPMVFYAYDLEEFRDSGRGFYEDYESYVPGMIVRSQKELEQKWGQWWDAPMDRIREFRDETYRYLDKNAVGRLFELIFGNE